VISCTFCGRVAFKLIEIGEDVLGELVLLPASPIFTQELSNSLPSVTRRSLFFN
jgi:hypothetical protein